MADGKLPTSHMPNTPMTVDATLVRELASLLKETDLSEIEVQDGERRIRVARQFIMTATPPAAAPAPAAAIMEVVAPVADISKHPGVVPSPMVGTAYLAPEPSKPDFISVGKPVAEGDTLMIIEAMKVMNPILAPRAGTIKRIFIANAQSVEYGEPLVVIE
jgi:acetyl-CoA carboxylase biotin carboxyl carrier protein